MPKVRITQDTLWYDHAYRKGEETVVEGREYLDLLMANRLGPADGNEPVAPAVFPSGDIENRHAGELIFVLGNGPSLALAAEYERELRSYTTIGVNRSFRMLKTTYLLFLDASLWAQESEGILGCALPVFCPRRLHLPCFRQFDRHHARDRKDILSEHWRDGLYWSRSSAVAAINLACLFGAAQIALLGVDMRDNSHFYSEHGRNMPFLHADEILEDLWWMSRRMLEKGLRLWNCSPESAVRGFEKIELGALVTLASENKPRR